MTVRVNINKGNHTAGKRMLAMLLGDSNSKASLAMVWNKTCNSLMALPLMGKAISPKLYHENVIQLHAIMDLDGPNSGYELPFLSPVCQATNNPSFKSLHKTHLYCDTSRSDSTKMFDFIRHP